MISRFFSSKLDAFINGGARFVGSIGIPVETAQTFMAVVIIAFAATSLDTGARIQRLVIAELGELYGVKALSNRYLAGGLGIGAALLLAVTQGGGQGGLALWPLFGTTNQLVAPPKTTAAPTRIASITPVAGRVPSSARTQPKLPIAAPWGAVHRTIQSGACVCARVMQ